MKVAIDKEGWGTEWIEFCIENNVEHIVVDCTVNNIIDQLVELKVTHLMWHFSHLRPVDILTARNVLFSVHNLGISVFPNFNGSWHFDDKVSQKYLLESIDKTMMVPSYVFYTKESAFSFLEQSTFPIVAKLRRGAGSYNVILLKSMTEGRRYVKRMFGRGLSPTPGFLADTKNKLQVAGNWEGIKKKLKKAPGFFRMVMEGKKGFPKEKGYVYFQEFMPGNKEDLRVGIVGDKMWAVKRRVRENDFRASGSGMPSFDYSDIDTNLVSTMFKIYESIGAQSMSFDLVKNANNEFVVVEISYGFLSSLFYEAPGYWNNRGEFINEVIKPERAIIIDFLKNE
ncbi:MAG TPA: hypothetical protein VIG40_08620 [Tissierellaceae bacterium]